MKQYMLLISLFCFSLFASKPEITQRNYFNYMPSELIVAFADAGNTKDKVQFWTTFAQINKKYHKFAEIELVRFIKKSLTDKKYTIKPDTNLLYSMISLYCLCNGPKFNDNFVISKEQTFIIKFLTHVDNGKFAKGKNFTNSPAMHNPKIVKILIEAGMDVNAPAENFDMRTPLDCAVVFNEPKIIEILMKAGANPLLPNSQNKTPIEACFSIIGFDQKALIMFKHANKSQRNEMFSRIKKGLIKLPFSSQKKLPVIFQYVSHKYLEQFYNQLVIEHPKHSLTSIVKNYLDSPSTQMYS